MFTRTETAMICLTFLSIAFLISLGFDAFDFEPRAEPIHYAHTHYAGAR